MLTWIGVATQVAAFQCDIETSSVAPTLAPEVGEKYFSCAPIPGGWRVLIYGLELVSGFLFHLQGGVSGISKVVAADQAGNPIAVVVMQLSNPQNLEGVLTPSSS